MTHDDHYHIHSDSSLPPPPAKGPIPPGEPPSNATVQLPVPRFDGNRTETIAFYSLKRDLRQLRRDAASKGILSPNHRPNIDPKDGEATKKMLSLVIGGHLWQGPGPVPKVLIVGCHHAREWMSVEIPYLIAEYLVDRYDKYPNLPASATAAPGTAEGQAQRIKHLVGNREIWFVPMLNVQGHDYTITNDRLWRTNRSETDFKETLTIVAPQFDPSLGSDRNRTITIPAGTPRAIGVDLNRNYNTTHWGEETYSFSSEENKSFLSTSRDPRDGGNGQLPRLQSYCGMWEDSERETRALSYLMDEQQFHGVISYHSEAQKIVAPDATYFDPFTSFVGNGMKELAGEGGGEYDFVSVSRFSAPGDPTSGDAVKYFIEKTPGRRLGYTIELAPTDPPKVVNSSPETEIRRVFRQNLAAALALINCAGFGAVPARAKTSFAGGGARGVVTVVPNCWNRFRGWNPAI